MLGMALLPQRSETRPRSCHHGGAGRPPARGDQPPSQASQEDSGGGRGGQGAIRERGPGEDMWALLLLFSWGGGGGGGLGGGCFQKKAPAHMSVVSQTFGRKTWTDWIK